MAEVPSLDFEENELEEDVQELIEINLMEVNTCMPGVIKSYDSETQTCTVTPSFKRTFIDGTVRSRADIEEVPVVFPRSGKYGVHFPIAEGDSVLIVFSQRSLDDWVDDGGVVTLTDYRLHNLTDAIVIPGLHPQAEKIEPAPIEGASELRGEKIFIGDPEAQVDPLSTMEKRDLVQAIDKLIDQLLLAVYPTSMGPTGPMAEPVAGTIQKIKAEIGGLLT